MRLTKNIGGRLHPHVLEHWNTLIQILLVFLTESCFGVKFLKGFPPRDSTCATNPQNSKNSTRMILSIKSTKFKKFHAHDFIDHHGLYFPYRSLSVLLRKLRPLCTTSLFLLLTLLPCLYVRSNRTILQKTLPSTIWKSWIFVTTSRRPQRAKEFSEVFNTDIDGSYRYLAKAINKLM